MRHSFMISETVWESAGRNNFILWIKQPDCRSLKLLFDVSIEHNESK